MGKTDIIKKILFAGILILLFLPMLQQKMHFAAVRPLKGAVTEIKDSLFSVEGYFSEDYQKQTEKYLNSAFGFRNIFVRLNNQIAFSIYRKATANGVVIGKENYLYEESYIKSFTGENFLGEKIIGENVRKLKQISDTLKSKNIDLIIVFAAGKASFYPEYIPDKYSKKQTQTNYECYLDKVQKQELKSIDFNKYFTENKYSSPYPLYPKTGIHWSTYGTAVATDSLSNYIRAIRNIDSPEMYWDTVNVNDTLNEGDRDIEEGMNLLFRIPNHPMGYPVLLFNEDGKQKPRVMTVADSYYWGIYGSGLASRLFERPEFWYYFKEAHIAGEPTQSVDQVDVKKEIEQQDVIVLMATEATLPEFPWGFTERVHAIYFGTDTQKSDSGN